MPAPRRDRRIRLLPAWVLILLLGLLPGLRAQPAADGEFAALQEHANRAIERLDFAALRGQARFEALVARIHVPSPATGGPD